MYGLGPLSETLPRLKREDVCVSFPGGEEEGVGSLVVQFMRLHGGRGGYVTLEIQKPFFSSRANLENSAGDLSQFMCVHRSGPLMYITLWNTSDVIMMQYL